MVFLGYWSNSNLRQNIYLPMHLTFARCRKNKKRADKNCRDCRIIEQTMFWCNYVSINLFFNWKLQQELSKWKSGFIMQQSWYSEKCHCLGFFLLIKLSLIVVYNPLSLIKFMSCFISGFLVSLLDASLAYFHHNSNLVGWV